MLVVATLQRAPVALSYQLKSNPGASRVTTTMTVVPTNSTITLLWQQITEEIRLTDAIIASSMFVIFVLITVIVTTIAFKRATVRKSCVYLDALSAAGCVQIKLLQLPHARRTFTIRQAQAMTLIEIQNYGLFGFLKIATEAIVIMDAVTNKRVTVPTRVIVSANKANDYRP
jgi:hypothetical protein